jgi:hypothetical protein
MSDPRNVAHAKKVTQEKKHHGAEGGAESAPTGQPGKKAAAKAQKHDPAGVAAASADTDAAEAAPPSESQPPAALEGALVVLAKLKEMEFHSRGNLERLAELVLTVGDELKQQQVVGPLDEVYSAQNVFQTKLTALIEAYQAECDGLRGTSA